GTGWALSDGLAVYCLNSTLCSCGGLPDEHGKEICDKHCLHVDTRTLQQWLLENRSNQKMLVMHHPVGWLAEWAQVELNSIIDEQFQLVVSGHVHCPSAKYASSGVGGAVFAVAPALFTRKSEELGYSFIT